MRTTLKISKIHQIFSFHLFSFSYKHAKRKLKTNQNLLLPSFTYTCKSQSTNTDYLVQLHSAAFLIFSCNISIERTDVFFHFSQIHTLGYCMSPMKACTHTSLHGLGLCTGWVPGTSYHDAQPISKIRYNNGIT